MKRSRASITDDQDALKFQHDNFPKEEYTFMHPTMRTVGSDLLILARQFNGNTGMGPKSKKKLAAIPVQKAFMARTIEYFKRKHDESSNWIESKPTVDDVLVWEAPENIFAKSVFAYIKSLHDCSVMPLSKKTCLGILQLAYYWCDDFMKKEALAFIEKNIDSEMVMGVYENAALRDILKDTVKAYIQRKEEACCTCCRFVNLYEFDNICYDDDMPEDMVKTYDEKKTKIIAHSDNEWTGCLTVYTKPIPEGVEERVCGVKLSFQLIMEDADDHEYGDFYFGIVDSKASDKNESGVGFHTGHDQPYQCSGFQLVKYEYGVDKETKELNKKTMVSFSGLNQTLTDIPTFHESNPVEAFTSDDIFTMTCYPDRLSVTNERGFNASVKIEANDVSTENRFFFTVGISNAMIGAGFKIVTPFETNKCQMLK